MIEWLQSLPKWILYLMWFAGLAVMVASILSQGAKWNWRKGD